MALRWTLFDLNGTLLDTSGIADPLGGGEQGLRLVDAAFHEALLLTMAATLSGAPYRPLTEYLRSTLERALRVAGRDTEQLDAAMERAAAMDPFPTADAALCRLRDAGLRVGVLTNTPARSAHRSLEHVGLRDRFEAVIGTDAVEVFKPHPRVYRHAVEHLEASPDEVCLVAAHGWDVMGAMQAGLRGAWVSQTEHWLTRVLPHPDVAGADLDDVAAKIVTHLG
jgi:2-haloacid dehalogenase